MCRSIASCVVMSWYALATYGVKPVQRQQRVIRLPLDRFNTGDALFCQPLLQLGKRRFVDIDSQHLSGRSQSARQGNGIESIAATDVGDRLALMNLQSLDDAPFYLGRHLLFRSRLSRLPEHRYR